MNIVGRYFAFRLSIFNIYSAPLISSSATSPLESIQCILVIIPNTTLSDQSSNLRRQKNPQFKKYNSIQTSFFLSIFIFSCSFLAARVLLTSSWLSSWLHTFDNLTFSLSLFVTLLFLGGEWDSCHSLFLLTERGRSVVWCGG